MFKKYVFIAIALITSCVYASIAVEHGEVYGGDRKFENSYRYGMPGLANVKISPDAITELPKGAKPLYIPAKYKVRYGGSLYDGLTLTKDLRIFLGNHVEDVLPEYGQDALYPYVLAVSNPIEPLNSESPIPVLWRSFDKIDDSFTVIEIGPFKVVGQNDPLLCQVTFFSDGEIQVQYWNLDRSNAYVDRSPYPSSQLTEKQYLGLPYVYTGVKRITLHEKAPVSIFSTAAVGIFSDGKLREGWIAKGFSSSEAQFDIIDKNLDVNFQKEKSSGGVIAYDYAREFPIVGSFQGLYIMVESLYPGDGVNENAAVPVYFWYFQEDEMFPSQAHIANYPRLANGNKLDFEKNNEVYSKNIVVAGGKNLIAPAAYGVSWGRFLEKNSSGDPDTIAAPAIKMITKDLAKNRNIRIKYIGLRTKQPRSIQFMSPTTYRVEYEGDVGYLEVNKVKAPLSLVENSTLNSKIYVTPGYTIKEIYVNGSKIYDKNNSSSLSKGFTVHYQSDEGIAYLESEHVSCNLRVKVIFEECSEKTRKLEKVIPSYSISKIYVDPTDTTKVVEKYSVKDGHGRVVQTQVPIADGKFKVSAVYLDDYGNVDYAPLPYVSKKDKYEYEDMFCQKCITKSKAYYNGDVESSKERVDSYGFPYSRTNRHYGENGALISTEAGMGEASFELGKNFVKTWRIPASTKKSEEFFSISQLKKNYNNDINSFGDYFDNIYRERLKALDKDESDNDEIRYPYILTINLSLDGVFTQSIENEAGNIVSSWMTQDGEEVVTVYVYNSQGKMVYSYVEGHPGFENSYEYDDAGRMISQYSADRGKIMNSYDSENRLRFSQNEKQRENNQFSVLIYDAQDRLILSGETRRDCNKCSFDEPDAEIGESDIVPSLRTIYGKPDSQLILDLDRKIEKDVVDEILSTMEGVKVSDVGAVVSYNKYGLVNTVKMSSYDIFNRVKDSWVINVADENSVVAQFSNEYDVSGNIVKYVVRVWNSIAKEWKFISELDYEYDDIGRLKLVKEKTSENAAAQSILKYTRNDLGTIEKTTYYDKGNEVFSKKVDGDIYGRNTKIEYLDKFGNELYKEKLTYANPLINRVSQIDHSWMQTKQGLSTSLKESFDYDELGRLSSHQSDDPKIGNSEYRYDIFNRILQKTEKDTTLTYEYDGFRPYVIKSNGRSMYRPIEFDAAGNVWLDGHQKVTYSLNTAGLPERVSFYGELPATLSKKDAEDEILYDEEYSCIKMAYDDVGNRVFERSVSKAGFLWSKIIIPGLGVYKKERFGEYNLDQIDLVAGGFRKGEGKKAIFPMSDAQGNIRGYASVDGIEASYGYHPYGAPEELTLQSTNTSDRLWQGKEYDGEHGKYFFGARNFDPFFGLWMSPDPAGQFANAYSYGGDPINYIDPTGMWSVSAGIAFGWDEQHGWHFGIEGGPFSFKWHQDGSETFSITAGGAYQYSVFNFGFYGGYSYNTYSGHNLSTGGHACIGVKKNEAGVCAGIGNDFGLNWGAEGDFMGGYASVEAFVQIQASDQTALVKASSGYEWGLLGADDRGAYFKGSAVGLYATYYENESKWSYGGEQSIKIGYANGIKDESGEKRQDLVRMELTLPMFGIHYDFGDVYDVGNLKTPNDKKINEILGEDPNKKWDYNKDFDEIERRLAEKGWVADITPSGSIFNRYHNGDKVTFRPKDYSFFGWGDLGNIEIIKDKGNFHSSYNYGNHWWTHLFIDVFGYIGRGY